MCGFGGSSPKKVTPVDPTSIPEPIQTATKIEDPKATRSDQRKKQGRNSLKIQRDPGGTATNVASPGSGISA